MRCPVVETTLPLHPRAAPQARGLPRNHLPAPGNTRLPRVGHALRPPPSALRPPYPDSCLLRAGSPGVVAVVKSRVCPSHSRIGRGGGIRVALGCREGWGLQIRGAIGSQTPRRWQELCSPPYMSEEHPPWEESSGSRWQVPPHQGRACVAQGTCHLPSSEVPGTCFSVPSPGRRLGCRPEQ